MAIEIQKRLYTGEELYQINSQSDQQYELSNGELVEVAPVNFKHGKIASRIDRKLGDYVEKNNLGEVVVETSYYLKHNPDTVRSPDISFLNNSKKDLAERTHKGSVDCIPDLVVEVLSPGNRPNDIITKLGEYIAAKVPLIWFVNPDEQLVNVHYNGKPLTVLSLENNDVLDGYDVVPGFKLPLRYIF